MNVPEMTTIAISPMLARVEPTFLCRKIHGIERSIRRQLMLCREIHSREARLRLL